jgi:hypothetical protein
LVVAGAVQLATGWMIHTDRLPLRDPIYHDKLALLRARPGFASRATSSDHPLTLIFLGSSRSLEAIDAGSVGPALTRRLGRPVEAFNFAHAGVGPVMSAVYLRRLLRARVNLDVVVIEVHPALLAARTPPPEAVWFTALRLFPEEVPLVRGLGLPVTAPAAHGLRGWLLPWYEYRVLLIDRYATRMTVFTYPVASHQPCDEHGFLRWKSTSSSERAQLVEHTHTQYEESLRDYVPGGGGVAGLRDMLETCRAAKICAALVLTPESSEFRSWYPEPGRSRIAPVLCGLAREFGCPLIDGRAWLPDELVGDGHHLTGPGADAFTARLTEEALAPWLASAKGAGP